MYEINIDNANKYFAIGNHINANLWLKFSYENRCGAITSAKRYLEGMLRRVLKTYDTFEFNPIENPIREDFACYEQALWMLLATPYGDANNGDAISILQGQNDTQAEDGKKRDELAPECAKLFGCVRGVLVRS